MNIVIFLNCDLLELEIRDSYSYSYKFIVIVITVSVSFWVLTLRRLIFAWIKFRGFRKITNLVICEKKSSQKFDKNKIWVRIEFLSSSIFHKKIHEIYLLVDDYCSCTVFVTARSTTILKRVSDIFAPFRFFRFLSCRSCLFLLRSGLVFSRHYLP